MSRNRLVSGVGGVVLLVVACGVGSMAVPALAGDTVGGAGSPTASGGPALGAQSGYNLTFNSTSISELVLRNVTVRDATVARATVDEVTVGDRTEENVTLTNVTFAQLFIDQGLVTDINTGKLSVRNRSIIYVPGAELIDNAGDQALGRNVFDNLTVTGVDIQRLHVKTLTVETEIEQLNATVETQPAERNETEPDVMIGNATVENASIGSVSVERGTVEDASVENETDDGSG